MTRVRKLMLPWLGLALALVFAGGQTARAASAEDRAYNAAVKAFQDGVWDRAEQSCAQFVQQFARSSRVPEVLLLEVQSQLQQRKYAPAIALASAQHTSGGRLADQFLYWEAEGQYQAGNYQVAAAVFARLLRDYPISAQRLAAAIGEAAARAKLGDWARVVQLLQNPGGEFQGAVRAGLRGETVVRGRLLLVEAELALNNFAAAQAALQPLTGQTLPPALDWQRVYLQCGAELGAGDLNAARASSTNLLALARASGRRDLQAESQALLGNIREQANDRAGAIEAYRENLMTNAPVEQQRQAILKIAVLAHAGNQLADAERSLDDYCTRFPASPVADLALLTLGELQLKEAVTQPAIPIATTTNAPSGGTNRLQQALGTFNRLITTYSNSALVGNAELDKGWCLWRGSNITDSASAFRAAVAHLPPSTNRVIARYKWADAQQWLNNYAGARSNYWMVAEELTNWPGLEVQYGAQVFYQIERASIELRDMAGATNVVERLLRRYPTNELADRSLLVLGQGYLDLGDPKAARACFGGVLATSPGSALRPEAELAIARTYGEESDWTGAITNCDAWLESHPTNDLRPNAEFYRAWATAQAGQETNALTLFTNFVAQFSTNGLAPLAQQWVADYYFGLGDYQSAERNYKRLFQTKDWPTSRLTYEAYLMAGRAAVQRQDYNGAIFYFTNMTSDPGCPASLKVQATLLYGDSLMRRPATETNHMDDLRQAVEIFSTIPQTFTNEQAAAAWGRMGDCYLQLAVQNPAAYGSASNAYWQVIKYPPAGVAARSQAEVGLGLVAEQLAKSRSGPERIALLRQARDDYLDVFYEANLRDGETPDLWWVKEAGLNAARVAESEPFQEWSEAGKFYARLAELLPQMRAMLEKKIANAKAQAQSQQDRN